MQRQHGQQANPSTSLRPPTESISSLASIPDQELDAYIAELILQKSRAKEVRSQTEGIGAYLQDDDAVPKADEARVPNTNKRFLASVIRNVEGHNQALLRVQAREAERAARNGERTGDSTRAKSNNSGQRDLEASRGSKGATSRMRGWSDDKLDENDDRSSHTSSIAGQEEGHISFEISRNMDKYFDEPVSTLQTELASDNATLSSSRRFCTQEHPKPKPHADNNHSSRYNKHNTSQSHENRLRSDHQDRKTCRHEKSERRKKQHGHNSKYRDHDDSKNDNDNDQSKRRRKEPKDASKSNRKVHKSVHNSRHYQHSSQREKQSQSDTNPSTSPSTHPPKLIREWDLGKASLSF
ncbi:uncharacterized protein UTRI_01191 [Ustilago trichophora]|uniref:Uncharacterized protein n=1 Tax=Ustilago trichophora TaxID=86804 RepID=A0A5C3DVR2_9BASI|nr:uncharacterized protein UTRI_01191 [Ustilago trichophora]